MLTSKGLLHMQRAAGPHLCRQPAGASRVAMKRSVSSGSNWVPALRRSSSIASIRDMELLPLPSRRASSVLCRASRVVHAHLLRSSLRYSPSPACRARTLIKRIIIIQKEFQQHIETDNRLPVPRHHPGACPRLRGRTGCGAANQSRSA